VLSECNLQFTFPSLRFSRSSSHLLNSATAATRTAEILRWVCRMCCFDFHNHQTLSPLVTHLCRLPQKTDSPEEKLITLSSFSILAELVSWVHLRLLWEQLSYLNLIFLPTRYTFGWNLHSSATWTESSISRILSNAQEDLVVSLQMRCLPDCCNPN